MSYSTGQYVVYSGCEICLIEDIVTKTFENGEVHDFFKLVPESSKTSLYYIPVSGFEEKVASPLTREEIAALVEDKNASDWITDKNERKQIFSNILKGNDTARLIGLIHTLSAEKQRLCSLGKKLGAADDRTLNIAVRQAHKCISFIMGISEKDAESYLQTALNT